MVSEILLKQTLWPESAIELYRQSDWHLSAKLVPTFFADKGSEILFIQQYSVFHFSRYTSANLALFRHSITFQSTRQFYMATN
jgi:hypothetical protein